MPSASLHDSQMAISLIKLTSRKVTYIYDLMDAAYDAKRIKETSREIEDMPMTDCNVNIHGGHQFIGCDFSIA